MNKNALVFSVTLVPLCQNKWHYIPESFINPLNAELNPICYLLALLGAHHILHVSRIRVNVKITSFENYAQVKPRSNRRTKL
jgi:hypothetical protein